MSGEMLTIACWSDNGAGAHSHREDVIEVDRTEWEAMNTEARWAYVRQEMTANDHFQYGFNDPLGKT